jgi:RND superfamily putative drug exporter
VLFSGLTVIVALLGMMIVPSTIFKSVSLGAVLVVTVAVTASLTLLPAILSLLDGRIERGRPPFLARLSAERGEAGFWSRAARIVMRRPVISLMTAVVVLLVVALPYLRIDLGMTGVSDFPADSSPRIAFQMLEDEFSAGMISPLEIVVESDDVTDPEVADGIERLTAELAARPEFGQARIETSPDGTLALISVPVAGEPESELAHDAVRELRGEIIPLAFAGSDSDVYVTGQTAFSRDAIDQIEAYTPYVFAFVLGASFLLLLVAFRSIVIPLKSILMNLLSVGAAYGVLVLVFQRGVGNELLGFQQVDNIVIFLPLFMFSVLFGLSMDYHVFILSRVKERYDETGDNSASVEHGVRTTGSVITGAAAIMVAVFSGFALGDFVQIQQLGFGLAVAVLLDATIVRSILLPATMRLLGDWNWYFPRWLEWLPKLSFEGSVTGPRPAPAPAR